MALSLIKLCVGIDSLDHLRQWQSRRLADMRRKGEPPRLCHWTRNTPRRAQEILGGGALYWVIRGTVEARQRIIAIDSFSAPEGERRCALVLDRELIETVPWPWRPFQGWRYLEASDAPPDRGSEAMPPAMARELRALGLI